MGQVLRGYCHTPRRSRGPITIDIGPAGGETAATFAEMRRRDPDLANVKVENSDTSQAISYVDAGRTDVAFFIARPDTSDPDFARVLESDTLELVPIVSRSILTPADNGGNVYTYRPYPVKAGRAPWGCKPWINWRYVMVGRAMARLRTKSPRSSIRRRRLKR